MNEKRFTVAIMPVIAMEQVPDDITGDKRVEMTPGECTVMLADVRTHPGASAPTFKAIVVALTEDHAIALPLASVQQFLSIQHQDRVGKHVNPSQN